MYINMYFFRFNFNHYVRNLQKNRDGVGSKNFEQVEQVLRLPRFNAKERQKILNYYETELNELHILKTISIQLK